MVGRKKGSVKREPGEIARISVQIDVVLLESFKAELGQREPDTTVSHFIRDRIREYLRKGK